MKIESATISKIEGLLEVFEITDLEQRVTELLDSQYRDNVEKLFNRLNDGEWTKGKAEKFVCFIEIWYIGLHKEGPIWD